VKVTKAMWEAERDAKRQMTNHLLDIVELGRKLAMYQPAANARTQAESDLWAKFYKALNDAPVSFDWEIQTPVGKQNGA
jgi:hypothetical protein